MASSSFAREATIDAFSAWEEEKDLKVFLVLNSRRDRHRARWAEYTKEWRNRNREKYNAQHQRYRAMHREKIREQNRARYATDPERHRAYQKRWYDRNRKRARKPGWTKEQLIAYRKAYYQKNKARILAQNRAWALKNPEKFEAIQAKYREKKRAERERKGSSRRTAEVHIDQRDEHVQPVQSEMAL
jgi:hypothetical protein